MGELEGPKVLRLDANEKWMTYIIAPHRSEVELDLLLELLF